MDFTTLRFLGFLAIVAALYRACPVRLRPLLLAVASYGFYWTWSGTMSLLLLGATAAAYTVARFIEAANREPVRRALALSMVGTLVGLLVFFKAAWFVGPLLGFQIVLPLGISYYTFKLISYTLDVYWGTVGAETNFFTFAGYAAFFPQIVAGPVERGGALLPQIRKPRPAHFDQIVLGVQRILLGYFKKFVVADNLGLLV